LVLPYGLALVGLVKNLPRNNSGLHQMDWLSYFKKTDALLQDDLVLLDSNVEKAYLCRRICRYSVVGNKLLHHVHDPNKIEACGAKKMASHMAVLVRAI